MNMCKQQQATVTKPEPWVTTEDIAEHLGKPVNWIHQQAANVGMPRRMLGNQYRYKISVVDAWLEAEDRG